MPLEQSDMVILSGSSEPGLGAILFFEYSGKQWPFGAGTLVPLQPVGVFIFQGTVQPQWLESDLRERPLGLLRLPLRLLGSVGSQRPTPFVRRLVDAEYPGKEFGQVMDKGTQQNAD